MKLFSLWIFLTFLFISSAYADLSVYYIDVGQGDAEYIVLPNGKKVLIDGGPSSATTSNLADFITSHNITQIDYVVLTHPHDDHYKGLNYVFDNCQVNNFYDTKMNNSGASGDETIRTKANSEPNCTIAYPSANDTLSWDSDVTVKVLNSCPNTDSSSNGDTINNSSIVLMITYAGKSLLFTGDIQSSKENDLVTTYGDDLRANYLKVTHHGSAYSSTTAFLDKVKPEKTFIEVGAGNSYGHPDAGTLTRLQNAGAEVFRTDTDGTKNISIVEASVPEIGSIKGYVKDSADNPVSGVNISLSGDASATYTTTSLGYYEFLNVIWGNYVVTPSQDSYDFEPTSRTYTLAGHYTDQNFTRLNNTGLITTYFIRGYILDSSAVGLSGVTVSLSGDTTGAYPTNSTGYYEFLNLVENKNYTVTPTKSNYSFVLTSRIYNNLSANQDNQNFVYTLMGKVNIVGGEHGYVNPAKGEKAKIVITPNESGTVVIKLYNLAGNKVWEKSESVSGNQTKTFFWDGKNEGGSTVSSGIYLLQIEGPGIKEKKKIAVVK